MEEVPRAVQKPSDIITPSFGAGIHLHETIRRRHQHHRRHRHRRDGGVRPGIPFGEIAAGTDETGAAVVPLPAREYPRHLPSERISTGRRRTVEHRR